MTAATEYAIATHGLGRRFGRNWVLKGLDLEVPKGCVFGFLGLNGAGKSTTMRMLMGLLTPHEGTIDVLGHDPARDAVAVKRRVGYVAEKPWFYEWMTVREVMAFAAHYRAREWDDAFAEYLVNAFKLPRDQKIKTFSKGQAAKVSLLLAMAFKPELLILDEPTGGLDPVVRREFVEKLLAEYMEEERTVLISSHLINEIAGLVDRVGILHNGTLLKHDTIENLFRQTKLATLTFEDDAPSTCTIPGLLRCRAEGRTARLTIDNFDPSETPAALGALGARNVVIEDFNLENLFIELTTAADGGAS
ncbi:MAG: type transport system ATP-binding protein [Candidatus Sumerlaeota bacterium]|nr:type transport system ATP-binding protein [Candidatus Sumerlaeota bacterium]